MASLRSLKRQLKNLEDQIDDLEDEISHLKKRRSDVKKVKSILNSTVRSNARDCNRNLGTAAKNLDDAIDYPGKDDQIKSILAKKEETEIGSDDDLTSADWQLQKELDDIEEQLEDAQDSLKEAKEDRKETKREICEKKDED